MVKLGDYVTDSITGLSGVVVGRAEYLYGCVSCQVQPKKLKDGASLDAEWIDEQRLGVSNAVAGGPQNNPPGRTNPT